MDKLDRQLKSKLELDKWTAPMILSLRVNTLNKQTWLLLRYGQGQYQHNQHLALPTIVIHTLDATARIYFKGGVNLTGDRDSSPNNCILDRIWVTLTINMVSKMPESTLFVNLPKSILLRWLSLEPSVCPLMGRNPGTLRRRRYSPWLSTFLLGEGLCCNLYRASVGDVRGFNL